MKNCKMIFLGLVFLVCGLVTGSAGADDDVLILGEWTWESLGERESKPGQVVSMRFEGGEVTFSAGVDGREISWTLAYTAEDGVLTIQPSLEIGEAAPSVISYRIEDGELIFESEIEGGVEMVFVRGD